MDYSNVVLHSADEGYRQAIANAAFLVVSRIDNMFDEHVAGTDQERLQNYLEAISQAPDDIFEALLNPDIQVLDYIAQEIVPTVADSYDIDPSNVTEDISTMIDFYSTIHVLGSLPN